MSIVLIIEVKNQLAYSQKCIDVYHHHTGIADIIYFSQSISLSLRELTGNRQQDYLQISVEKEAERPQCFYLIDLPLWAHFQVNLKGHSNISSSFSENRHRIKLSLAKDFWQMKIFKPIGSSILTRDSVTIQDKLSKEKWRLNEYQGCPNN